MPLGRLTRRSRCWVVLAAAALVLPVAGCAGRASTEQITVSGSTTILPIAEIAAERFTESQPGTKVLVSGLGSSAGIEAVDSGTAEIGSSSRDLKPEEETLGLIDTPIAYDGIAVIVHPDNPVDDLSVDELRDIFTGRITNWEEVGGVDRAINLVNRDEASGTREAFKKIVMGDERFEPRAVVLPGTGQVRDVVSRSQGAIGYISVGFVEPRFTGRRVKAVSVEGVEPSEATVSSGEYPIARTLHFFTKGPATGLSAEYIAFVLSDEIQEDVVVEAGFVPVTRQAPSTVETSAP